MLKSLLGRKEAPAPDVQPDPVPEKNAPERRKAAFRGYLGAAELASIMRSEKREGARLLDIGGAYGVQARYFRTRAPDVAVEIVDSKPVTEPLVFEGFYSDYQPQGQYDYIWASHVLEHIPNPGLFFDKLWMDLKPGGWAAITVPPLKHDMTFAHVTLWNAGLLLIHFIQAGFDCRQARICSYDYNITVIVQKAERPPSKSASLPEKIGRKGHYFEGDIKRMNWKTKTVPIRPIDNILPLDEAGEHLAASRSVSGFYPVMDGNALKPAYWDAAVSEIFPVR